MTFKDLRDLMAEARATGITCVDLAGHPEVRPYWAYRSISEYFTPAYKGRGPSRIFIDTAAQALADLILKRELARRGDAA